MGSFRVVHWNPFIHVLNWNLLNWKTIKHFQTPEETKAYVKSLTENDKSKLDIKPDAFKILYCQ